MNDFIKNNKDEPVMVKGGTITLKAIRKLYDAVSSAKVDPTAIGYFDAEGLFTVVEIKDAHAAD